MKRNRCSSWGDVNKSIADGFTQKLSSTWSLTTTFSLDKKTKRGSRYILTIQESIVLRRAWNGCLSELVRETIFLSGFAARQNEKHGWQIPIVLFCFVFNDLLLLLQPGHSSSSQVIVVKSSSDFHSVSFPWDGHPAGILLAFQNNLTTIN
eukprot:scaffold948_cov106-Cylindrotheca_fusiformis.AAC.9